MEDFMSL